MRGLLRALDEGCSAVIVSDGPRPPPYEMKPGPVFLARASGRPLYVARAWARPQFFLARTWFRMAVPLPSAHCALFSEGPLDVGGDIEAARSLAENALNRLCEETDAHLYLRKRIGGGVRLCRPPERRWRIAWDV